MPLDPQAQVLLDQMAAMGTPPLHSLTPEQGRQVLLVLAQMGGDPEPVARIEDREIRGAAGPIPIRVYTPAGTGPFPMLIYFHGGGWVLGSLETHDPVCRSLTNAAGCVTVSVDYRLAPEHKFPAAPDDCYAATRWLAANAADFNANPERIAVGGDSAGGNLAAVVALMSRDRGGPALVHQMLIYPVTDYLPATRSSRENAQGYFLTSDDMAWFWNHYVRDQADGNNPYASPLRAASLSGLPPALVITAEFDPLRDEGEIYAARLQEAGVPVTAIRYDGMIHGFFSMAGTLTQGRNALNQAAAELRRAFEETQAKRH
jgi:acetyl esterase